MGSLVKKVDTISVAFSINSGYVKQLSMALFSLLRNNTRYTFKIFVLHTDLKTGDKKAIREITGLHNAEVEFVTVERGMFEKLKLNIEHISVETYYRYILPDILPRNIKKVLYLDADILVAGDIGYLWNEDIEKYYIAGVEDTLILDENYKKDIGLEDSDIYVNAGVLLMNVDLMRRESISDRLFLNTGKYADIIKYQDQDVLNLTLKGKIKGISRIYNFTSRDSVKYLDQAHDARIIHFTGPEKPWNNYGGDGRIYTHYLYDKYIDFMSMTREEPSELQLAILGVYKEFKRICDENGLRYYANGGTKIGAVRHEGFIPWDDDIDIDIDMPMEDYYKFIKLTKQHLGPDYELRHMFGGITSTLVNKNTMYTEYYYLGYPEKYTGIFVDIHPVFGTPENEQERREFVDKMFELANDIIFNSIAGNYTDTETSLRPEFKEYRELSTMYPVNQSSYLLTVLGRLRDRGLYEAKAFLNSFNLKFEDTTVPVSIGFDAQLKKQYGDYSLRGAPTTEAERSIHKSRAIIDIHKSYSAYAIELKDSELAKASRYLSRQVAMGWLEISKKDTENKGLRFNLEQARTRSPDVLGIKESIKSTARAVYRRITR